MNKFHFILVSRGDVPRNQGYVPYDDFPNEPKYDRFAYENDKKMWGMDNDVPEDEDEGNLRSPPRKHRKNDYSRGLMHFSLDFVTA